MHHFKIPLYYVLRLVCKTKNLEVFGFVVLWCLYNLSLFCIDLSILCVTHDDFLSVFLELFLLAFVHSISNLLLNNAIVAS